jgi:hypothetical protein
MRGDEANSRAKEAATVLTRMAVLSFRFIDNITMTPKLLATKLSKTHTSERDNWPESRLIESHEPAFLTIFLAITAKRR